MTQDLSKFSVVYPIACPPGGPFVCGTTSSDELALLGLGVDSLLALFFSKEGEFLRVEERTPILTDQTALSAGEAQFQASIQMAAQLRRWRDELGLAPSPIHIRRFFIPHLDIGISGLPNSFLLDFRRRPEMSQEQQADFDRMVLEWHQEKRFVLWWNQEMWMNGQGEITDT